MEKLDIEILSKVINKQEKELARKKSESNPNRIPLESNKDKFTKVAWDIFHMIGEPENKIWIVEKDEDGNEYLARMGDWESSSPALEGSNWTAAENKEASCVTLIYKDTPVAKFSSKEFNFNKSDVGVFKESLIKMVSSDYKPILNSMLEQDRNSLLERHPELKY